LFTLPLPPLRMDQYH